MPLFLFFCNIKFLSKLLNTTACINKLLFAGKERVAFGANFNADVFFCGTGFNHVAARALNYSLFIIRMNALFHVFHLTNIITIVLTLYHKPNQIASFFLFFRISFPAGNPARLPAFLLHRRAFGRFFRQAQNVIGRDVV